MPKSRRRDDWSDLFEMFDEEFTDIREHMDRILERLLSGELTEGGDPLIYGFSMRVSPDGTPSIQEFGNAKARSGSIEEAPLREPLTDIIENQDKVAVIMELPGVEKKDIKVNAEDRSLDLEVESHEKRFRKHLELPCDVLPDSARANYKNGVLEVVMQRSAPKKRRKTLRVE